MGQLPMVETIQRENNLCAAYIPGQYHASITNPIIVLSPVVPRPVHLPEAAAQRRPCREAAEACRSSVESAAMAALQDHTDPGTRDAMGRPWRCLQSERRLPLPRQSPAR